MMSKSAKYKLKFKKIYYIANAWVLISIFQVFYDYLVVINFTGEPSIFRFWSILTSNTVIALIGGILSGILIVYIVEPWLRRFPFVKVLLLLFLLYGFFGFFLISLGSLFYQSYILSASPFDALVQEEVFNFITGVDFIKYFTFWGMVFIGSVISSWIYDKYSPGNFENLLLGKYFHPRSEERIFMFLDLRNSTGIAEKIGNQRYFSFIHDFINDATDPILFSQGEIYQYVGDEIVISWQTNEGINPANCIHCFFDIKEAIQEKAAYYKNEYGCVPSFKAGIHVGTVISGEIGTIKKEIAFSGDVLNTASRIQNECNKHNLDLLVSIKLLNLVGLSTQQYQIENIGKIQLRGKSEEINLSTIRLLEA